MMRKIYSQFIAVLLVGISVSLAVTIFMKILGGINSFFETHPILIYFLPFAGLVLAGLKTQKFFSKLETTHEIERELQRPERKISSRLAPAIVLMTWWSHLFGASVGREMVGIQVGASVSDALLTRLQKISHLVLPRDLILQMGVAAGFSAVFASPFAACIFAFEISRSSFAKIKSNLVPLILVSLLSFFIILKMNTPHLYFPSGDLGLQWADSGSWIVYSILLVAFAAFYHIVLEKCLVCLESKNTWLVHFLGGLILTFLAIALQTTKFHGLSLDLLHQSFLESLPVSDAIAKASTILISIASGFKGGEVVPLMITGGALGSALSSALHLPLFDCVAVGLAVLFCYRLNCPATGIAWIAFAFSLKLALVAIVPMFFVFVSRRKS